MSSFPSKSFFSTSSSRNKVVTSSSRSSKNAGEALNHGSRPSSGSREAGASLRDQGNVVVSTKELGRVFDALNELSNAVRGQQNKLNEVVETVNQAENYIGELKRQVDDLSETITMQTGTLRATKSSVFYGPIPKEVKVMLFQLIQQLFLNH